MLHFIINPHSSTNKGKEIWERLELILRTRQEEYLAHFTEYKCHATQIAREITSDGAPHTLVVLGGDGSINEVINGICFPSKVTLGYIPLGSGNDFARSLHIPSDPEKALDLILHSSRFRQLNLGILTDSQGEHRFAVSSGMGYDASICHQVSVSRLKRIFNFLKLGQLSYVALSISTLLRWHPKKMNLTIDGTKSLHFKKVYFAAAMNLPYEGGGCKFCPSARPDDGFLDLIVIADVPKIAALAILPAVFSGSHIHMKGVHIYRFRQLTAHSETPLVLHTDGEPIPQSFTARWSLTPDSIRLIVP
ncbi:MAG: diacylglycerol/lipid kinase family protein [Bariatricus sp.]